MSKEVLLLRQLDMKNAEIKILRAVVDAAKKVRAGEHRSPCRGGWTDHVPGLLELKQALAAVEEKT